MKNIFMATKNKREKDGLRLVGTRLTVEFASVVEEAAAKRGLSLAEYVRELHEMDRAFTGAAVFVDGRRLPPRTGLVETMRDYFWQLAQPGHGPKEKPPVIVLPDHAARIMAEATAAVDSLPRPEAARPRSRQP